MPGQIVIYRGLPGSGKTTVALQSQEIDGGRVVGRDHIRRLLGIPAIGNSQQENEVTELQTRMIIQGLLGGQVVHVDDMNLRSQYVRRLIALAEKHDAEWGIVDLTWVDVETCHERNKNRFATVPPEVIDNNYAKFIKGKSYPLPVPESNFEDLKRIAPKLYVPNKSKPRAFLVDIDGTVAIHDGIRGHHDYDKVLLDLPNAPVIRVVQSAISGGLGIPLFVSGRPDSCRNLTRRWLNKHVTTLGGLIMRDTGDHRPDYIVKLELFDKRIRDNYDVVIAFDDRQQVVNMYREIGITVAQVAEGMF